MAVNGTLNVCGYMMLFSVAAALIARIARSEWAGLAAVCLLELPSAARAVSALALRRETRLLMLAALVLCTAYLVSSTYNPFLYFRF